MAGITRRQFIRNAAVIGWGATIIPPAWAAGEGSEERTKNESSGLLLPPYLGKPTPTSIAVNLVSGAVGMTCSVEYRPKNPSAEHSWEKTALIKLAPFSPQEVVLKALSTGTRYEYRIQKMTQSAGGGNLIGTGDFMTQRESSKPFGFALFSDAHITPQYKDRLNILSAVSRSVGSRKPDFGIMLGDNIQTFTSHGGPMTEPRFGPILYANLRIGLGQLPAAAPLYYVNGNWEGENGWHPEREKGWARTARRSFIPSIDQTTYPQGGSKHGDYYAFEWGNTLFVILNVTGYTLTDHRHTVGPGRADEWTLGESQRNWLLQTLKSSNARWKLLFIHHTVGGNAGDDINSRYGRGGGRAAHVGEQDLIHQWMKTYGVQALFYGHDHVFTDIPVDGIHYICVGSAGAPWKFDTDVTGYENYLTPSGYTWVSVDDSHIKVSYIRPDPDDIQGKVLHHLLLT